VQNIALINRPTLREYHYVQKADPSVNYWFELAYSRIEHYSSTSGDNFALVIVGSEHEEADFYVIPYIEVKSILVKTTMSKTQRGYKRWIGSITNHKLRINNSPSLVNVEAFYGNPHWLDIQSKLEEKEIKEYAIANRRMEINARIKQSVFRAAVLKNFNQRCCLTGITEPDLLVASHIVPWAASVDSRLDPANGLCLFSLYDQLFDHGYLTFTDALHVQITLHWPTLSPAVQKVLQAIDGAQAVLPLHYRIKPEYLAYHRTHIFRH